MCSLSMLVLVEIESKVFFIERDYFIGTLSSGLLLERMFRMNSVKLLHKIRQKLQRTLFKGNP